MIQPPAFRDNRAARRNPINDGHGHQRAMHSITLKGDAPV